MLYTDECGHVRDSEAGHAKVTGMADDSRFYNAIIATDFTGADLLRLAREAVDHATDWHDIYRRKKAAQVMDTLDLLISDMEDRP
jgi:hypothetical protein